MDEELIETTLDIAQKRASLLRGMKEAFLRNDVNSVLQYAAKVCGLTTRVVAKKTGPVLVRQGSMRPLSN